MKRKTFLPTFLAIAVILSAGCRQEPVRTYQIAKERSEPPAQAIPTDFTPTAPGITWTAPAGWEARAPTSVRVGNYSIPDPAGGQAADFAITTFPGDVGGDLANVNRWRQQIGLPAVSDSELPALLKRTSAPAGEFITVNFANPAQGTRVLSSIFKQPDKTWFFKLAGPDALVAAQEQSLDSLLQSVRFEEGLAPPSGVASAAIGSGNTNDLPPGHPPIGGMPAAIAAVAAPGTSNLPLRWAPPDHWIAKELAPLRKASYRVHGANALEADFSVISLAGDAGGLHENVNRWRGQIGLAPESATVIDASVSHIDSAGLHFDVVEFASDGAEAQRVLGAFLNHGGETWFFKMTGPDAIVAAERDSFIRFIRTIRAQ